MPVTNLQSTIDAKNLIDYSLFTNMDATTTNTLVNLSDLEASDKIINFKLRLINWKGYKSTRDGVTTIGYASTNVDAIAGTGLIESAAYTLYIEMFKDKERIFKKVFPLSTLTQSQYDAMLSLYIATSTFSYVGTEDRKFYILDDIKDRKWDHVATALTLSGLDRTTRQLEAKILMLSDYGSYKDRALIKEQSLQHLIKDYKTNQLTDEQKTQAEYVYYAETNRFLTNMTESKKRLLVKQLS